MATSLKNVHANLSGQATQGTIRPSKGLRQAASMAFLKGSDVAGIRGLVMLRGPQPACMLAFLTFDQLPLTMPKESNFGVLASQLSKPFA